MVVMVEVDDYTWQLPPPLFLIRENSGKEEYIDSASFLVGLESCKRKVSEDCIKPTEGKSCTRVV